MTRTPSEELPDGDRIRAPGPGIPDLRRKELDVTSRGLRASIGHHGRDAGKRGGEDSQTDGGHAGRRLPQGECLIKNLIRH